MDVNQKLIITNKGDINNNNTQLSLPHTTINKLHTSSTSSAIVKPADIDLNLIRKSNTTNTLNSQTNPNPKQFSNNNNEISFSNTLNDNLNENNSSDIDSDNDATSPLKNNVNRSLSHEIENKTSELLFSTLPFSYYITPTPIFKNKLFFSFSIRFVFHTFSKC